MQKKQKSARNTSSTTPLIDTVYEQPTVERTRARNRAFLLFLVLMIIIFYGLGMTRINGGVGL